MVNMYKALMPTLVKEARRAERRRASRDSASHAQDHAATQNEYHPHALTTAEVLSALTGGMVIDSQGMVVDDDSVTLAMVGEPPVYAEGVESAEGESSGEETGSDGAPERVIEGAMADGEMVVMPTEQGVVVSEAEVKQRKGWKVFGKKH
ncbi:hypothetical protein HK101_004994 [Irineochytrium annulatum]|nr:hypothetical protein HK101_004994 [Irineochytrium annulatum]